MLRLDPPAHPELWDQHVDTGFAKRSVIADLGDPVERVALEELLADADAVVIGYRPGALARFGWDPSGLGARHPRLVTVALDAWGDSGPWGERRGFDSIVQAAVGIAQLYGIETEDGWRPGALPVQALDHATGMGVASAVVALLAARAEGRLGSAHLSLAGTAAHLLAAPPPPADAAVTALDVPLHTTPSPYGELTYVPPSLTVDGVALDYRAGPQRYGGAELTWC